MTTSVFGGTLNPTLLLLLEAQDSKDKKTKTVTLKIKTNSLKTQPRDEAVSLVFPSSHSTTDT